MPIALNIGVQIMPTRNVVLTDYQAQMVEKLVASGRYQNASEVLREGLRLVEDREAQEKARLKALREAARIGMADIDAGRFRRFESATAMERHLVSIANVAIGRKRSASRSE
jgi:antitoxin ParD1/3/4